MAVAVAIAAVAVVLLAGGPDRQRYVLRFENASQLVKGNEVKVGGVAVGSVDDIRLADDNAAEVEISVTDGDLLPLHAGTRAEIRVSSLSSVANRFVQLHPGPNDAPELEEGATLRAESTDSAVEIDSVLATLDADTRRRAQELLAGSRTLYSGRTDEANAGLEALNPALAQLDLVARDLTRDSTRLERFLVRSAAAVGAVASRDPDLEAALDGAAGTARELADERGALAGALRRAPGTLGEATSTLRAVAGTFEELRPAARELRPVAPRLAALVRELQPLLRRSGPALSAVRAVLPDAGAALRALPGLRDTALPAFTAVNAAVDDALPVLTGLRPYVPDLFHGFVTGFGNTGANSYDANGAYARIGAVVTKSAPTGAASALLQGLPGKSDSVKRCPGGAYPNVAGSANNTQLPDARPCRPEDAP